MSKTYNLGDLKIGMTVSNKEALRNNLGILQLER